MKNGYRIILPVFLPLVLLFSVLYLVQERQDIDLEYRTCISNAESYAENGLPEEAIASYKEALAIRPSMEVYLSVGELYLNQQEYRDAIRWYEDEMAVAYPNDSRTYEFAIRTLLAQGNTREAFQVYDQCQERKASSDAIVCQMEAIWYSFDLKGEYSQVKGFSGSTQLAAVKQGERWGYINANGSRVISNLFQKAGSFTDLAPVVDQDGEAYFIDTSGNKKLTTSYFTDQDPEFGEIVEFQDKQSGLIAAYNGELWNYYDAQTYQKKFGGYVNVMPIVNGVGAVSRDGKAWALISQDGQELTGFDYEQIVADSKAVICCTNAIIVRQDGSYRLIDKTGQPIGQAKYEEAYAFNENSLAAVKKDGKWIFVSETGEERDLGDFEELKSFSSGIAAAKQGGKWGYIDSNGEWIIEPQFEDAEAFFSKGCAFVETEKNVWRLLVLYRFQH